MKLERLEEVLSKHNTCIEVPSFSSNDFTLTNIDAYINGYNIEIKYNNNFTN